MEPGDWDYSGGGVGRRDRKQLVNTTLRFRIEVGRGTTHPLATGEIAGVAPLQPYRVNDVWGWRFVHPHISVTSNNVPLHPSGMLLQLQSLD